MMLFRKPMRPIPIAACILTFALWTGQSRTANASRAPRYRRSVNAIVVDDESSSIGVAVDWKLHRTTELSDEEAIQRVEVAFADYLKRTMRPNEDFDDIGVHSLTFEYVGACPSEHALLDDGSETSICRLIETKVDIDMHVETESEYAYMQTVLLDEAANFAHEFKSNTNTYVDGEVTIEYQRERKVMTTLLVHFTGLADTMDSTESTVFETVLKNVLGNNMLSWDPVFDLNSVFIKNQTTTSSLLRGTPSGVSNQVDVSIEATCRDRSKFTKEHLTMVLHQKSSAVVTSDSFRHELQEIYALLSFYLDAECGLHTECIETALRKFESLGEISSSSLPKQLTYHIHSMIHDLILSVFNIVVLNLDAADIPGLYNPLESLKVFQKIGALGAEKINLPITEVIQQYTNMTSQQVAMRVGTISIQTVKLVNDKAIDKHGSTTYFNRIESILVSDTTTGEGSAREASINDSFLSLLIWILVGVNIALCLLCLCVLGQRQDSRIEKKNDMKNQNKKANFKRYEGQIYMGPEGEVLDPADSTDDDSDFVPTSPIEAYEEEASFIESRNATRISSLSGHRSNAAAAPAIKNSSDPELVCYIQCGNGQPNGNDFASLNSDFSASFCTSTQSSWNVNHDQWSVRSFSLQNGEGRIEHGDYTETDDSSDDERTTGSEGNSCQLINGKSSKNQNRQDLHEGSDDPSVKIVSPAIINDHRFEC